jgi:hypothetical protein
MYSWTRLRRILVVVLNNGIGSANIDDVLYYFDRLVTAYQPQAVLMVPSPTDFIMRDNKSPEDFAQGPVEPRYAPG